MTTEQGRVIAIVDDDESVRRALGRLVRSLSYTSELFASGDALLGELGSARGFTPHCVVLDVQMPGLNGLEVQQHLRRERRNVAVIFVTAYDAPEVREQALADGAVAYLRKPFDHDDFVRVLSGVMNRESAGTPGRHAEARSAEGDVAPTVVRVRPAGRVC